MPYKDLFVHEVFHFRQVDLIHDTLKKTSGAAKEQLAPAKGGVCDTLTAMWAAGINNTHTGWESLAAMKQKGLDTAAGQAFWTQALAQNETTLLALKRINQDVSHDDNLNRLEKRAQTFESSKKFRVKIQSFTANGSARSVEYVGSGCGSSDTTAPLMTHLGTYILEIFRNYQMKTQAGHSVGVTHTATGYALFDSNFGMAPFASDIEFKNGLGQMFQYYHSDRSNVFLVS